MSAGKVFPDYTSCGSLNFMPSRKILQIAEMIEQAEKGARNSTIRKKAFEIVKNVHQAPLDIKKKGDEERNKIAEALFLWVRDNIAYINDPPGEYFQPSLETLKVAAGDCDDQSILLAAMLGSIGFEPIFVILPEHVYIELQQATGEPVPMDPIAKNAVFGELPKGMRDYLKERYGLVFEDYLRVPVGRHIIVTPAKEIVETKRPLKMAIHNEQEGATAYDQGDYRAGKYYFLAASKMYYEAAGHTDSPRIKEGLLASSKFSKGWSDLAQMTHLLLSHNNNHFFLLQSAIGQARSSFEASRLYFEKIGNTGLTREIEAIITILTAYEETLLADLLKCTGDDEASERHYAKAKKIYREATTRTKLPALREYLKEAMNSLSYAKKISPPPQETFGKEVKKIRKSPEDDLSERLDMPLEALRKMKDNLAKLRGEELRRELLRLSVKESIPLPLLETIHNQTMEISLRVDYPDPREKHGHLAWIHPEVIERLGLHKVDRARIISAKQEYIAMIRSLDKDEESQLIKLNRRVRDLLGVEVGDLVKIERVV